MDHSTLTLKTALLGAIGMAVFWTLLIAGATSYAAHVVDDGIVDITYVPKIAIPLTSVGGTA